MFPALGWLIREIPGFWVHSDLGVGPWPETLTKREAYLFDEGLIQMGFEELFKTVNI